MVVWSLGGLTELRDKIGHRFRHMMANLKIIGVDTIDGWTTDSVLGEHISRKFGYGDSPWNRDLVEDVYNMGSSKRNKLYFSNFSLIATLGQPLSIGIVHSSHCFPKFHRRSRYWPLRISSRIENQLGNHLNLQPIHSVMRSSASIHGNRRTRMTRLA